MRNDLSKPSRTNRPFCKVYFPTCKQCGNQFVARSSDAVLLCSEACRDASREAACLYPRTCKACGCEFTRKWAHDVCSDVCQKLINRPKRKAYNKIARKKRRALGIDPHHHHYDRARRYGVAYESINRRKVYERDGWKCMLCRKPIKQGVVVPHPLSATIDCIIPLSKGGAYLYANVQTAHFICNSIKGNRSQGEQLLLVG